MVFNIFVYLKTQHSVLCSRSVPNSTETPVPHNSGSTPRSASQTRNAKSEVHPSSSNASSSERPIPPSPENFYQALHRTGKSGVKLPASGVPALPGLGANPSSSPDSEVNENKKFLSRGPDVTGQCKPPTTVKEATKYLIGSVSPLINRAGVDTEEKLIEQAFMEATVDDIKDHLKPAEKTDVNSQVRGLDFMRNPIPWIKGMLGYEDEEPEGFHEIPYFQQPAAGVDREWAVPALYHGEATLDMRRRARIEHQTRDEIQHMLKSQVNEAPLHRSMNDGKAGHAANALRHGAATAVIGESTEEVVNQARYSWGNWFSSELSSDTKDKNSKENQLWGVAGVAWIILGISFSALFVQQRYDFIGDLTPTPKHP